MSMQLVLTQKIEELVPQLIAWNNSELMANVTASLEKYKGIVYDENSIADAKLDRATLNKFSSALNDERIRISAVYNEPLAKFKGEVDGVISLVRGTIKEIDCQVSAHEQARKDIKQDLIKTYFNEVIDDLANFVALTKIEQSKWLNASTSLKSIKADIDDKIATIRTEILTIEALRSDDEPQLKALYFRALSLSSAITEESRLKSEKQRIIEANAKKIVSVVPNPPNKSDNVTAALPILDSTPEIEYTILFSVTATRNELKALSEFLKENNYKYQRI